MFQNFELVSVIASVLSSAQVCVRAASKKEILETSILK